MGKLRVGVFEHDPDAFKCFRKLPNGLCDKPGAEMEIFSAIMTILGLDYDLVDIEQQYGTGKDYGSDNGNGSWSGMVGLLINGSIDLTALTIRMTSERAAVIDFSFPVRYYQTVYILKRPGEFDFRNFIFNAFTNEVWVIFLLCVAAANAVHFICVLLLLPHHHTWMYRIEYAFNMMMDERERYWCCSLLTKMYVFSALVMSEYYQSVMSTNLMAPSRTKMPFLTQDQLIDLLNAGKCHLTYFVNAQPPCAGDDACERIKDALVKNPIIVHADSPSLMNDLYNDGGVYFGSEDIDFVPNIASRYNKNLTIIRDTSIPMYYVSFGFARSQKILRERFNAALVTMLLSVPYMKTRSGYAKVKVAEDGSYRAQSGALSLDQHMQQLFVWWAVSIGGVLVCFVIELLWFFRARLTLVQRTISVGQSRFGFGLRRRLVERPAKEELVSAPLDNGFVPFPASDQWWMSDEANN